MTKGKWAGRAALRGWILLLIFTLVFSEAPAFSDMKAEGMVRVSLNPATGRITLVTGSSSVDCGTSFTLERAAPSA